VVPSATTKNKFHRQIDPCAMLRIDLLRPCSGTTWYAAGLIVAGLLTSEAECEIYTHVRDLYANLEKETGLPAGFRDVGYLQIASSAERVLRCAALCRSCGGMVSIFRKYPPRRPQTCFQSPICQTCWRGFIYPKMVAQIRLTSHGFKRYSRRSPLVP